MSALEDHFAMQMLARGFPQPVREFRFATHLKTPPTTRYKNGRSRQWRFDFAWPDRMIAVEVEGGTFSPGKSGHTSGVGYGANCLKYNTATALGWCVFRGDTKMVNDASLVEMVERFLKEGTV